MKQLTEAERQKMEKEVMEEIEWLEKNAKQEPGSQHPNAEIRFLENVELELLKNAL